MFSSRGPRRSRQASSPGALKLHRGGRRRDVSLPRRLGYGLRPVLRGRRVLALVLQQEGEPSRRTPRRGAGLRRAKRPSRPRRQRRARSSSAARFVTSSSTPICSGTEEASFSFLSICARMRAIALEHGRRRLGGGRCAFAAARLLVLHLVRLALRLRAAVRLGLVQDALELRHARAGRLALRLRRGVRRRARFRSGVVVLRRQSQLGAEFGDSASAAAVRDAAAAARRAPSFPSLSVLSAPSPPPRSRSGSAPTL